MDVNKASDYKEVLDIGREDSEDRISIPFHGPNNWPTAFPELKRPVLDHQEQLWKVANDLTHAFALALGQEEDFFDRYIDDPIIIHRMNYYPPQDAWSDDSQLSCRAQTPIMAFSRFSSLLVGATQICKHSFLTPVGWESHPRKGCCV